MIEYRRASQHKLDNSQKFLVPKGECATLSDGLKSKEFLILGVVSFFSSFTIYYFMSYY